LLAAVQPAQPVLSLPGVAQGGHVNPLSTKRNTETHSKRHPPAHKSRLSFLGSITRRLNMGQCINRCPCLVPQSARPAWKHPGRNMLLLLHLSQILSGAVHIRHTSQIRGSGARSGLCFSSSLEFASHHWPARVSVPMCLNTRWSRMIVGGAPGGAMYISTGGV